MSEKWINLSFLAVVAVEMFSCRLFELSMDNMMKESAYHHSNKILIWCFDSSLDF